MSQTGFLKRIDARKGAQDQICRPPWHSLDFGIFATVNGRSQLMPKNQLHCEVANAASVTSYPAQQTASINGGSFVFYVIPANLMDVRKTQVHFTIQETGGVNPCTLVPTALMIDYVVVSGQGGSKELQRIEGDSIWLHNAGFRSTEEWLMYGQIANESPGYASGGVSILAGTTVDYYVDLPLLFAQADFYWGNVDQQVNVTIKLRDLSATQTAGTGVPAITNAELVFQQNELSLREMEVLRGQKNTTVFCRYTDDVHQNINQSFSAGTQYDLKLDSLSGIIDWTFFAFRAASLSGAALYTFLEPGTGAMVSLTDETGSNINGGSPLPYKWVRYEWAQWLPSPLQGTAPVLFWNHSKDPVKTYKDGSLHGFYVMDGNQRFRLQTGSGLATANYNADFFAKKHSMLKVENGRLERLES